MTALIPFALAGLKRAIIISRASFKVVMITISLARGVKNYAGVCRRANVTF
jgi:hypothetical protein